MPCDGQRGERTGKEVAPPAAAGVAELPVASPARPEPGSNNLPEHVDYKQHTADVAPDDVQNPSEACHGTCPTGVPLSTRTARRRTTRTCLRHVTRLA